MRVAGLPLMAGDLASALLQLALFILATRLAARALSRYGEGERTRLAENDAQLDLEREIQEDPWRPPTAPQ